MVFTICIPTYNRAYTIERALKSLEQQTFTDFEVIIVDDGSTDNTYDFLQSYIKFSKLDIKYFFKPNGGKHTALNVGIKEALGEFFLILDSDDALTEDALKNLNDLWNTIPDSEKNLYSGVMGRCISLDGKIIGNPFPTNRFISSYVDFHFISGRKNGLYGDCCEFIRTSIIKNYRFPEVDEVKFIPEAYIFDQVGEKYKLLCTNEVYKVVEYLTDGITKNVEKHKNDNYLGYFIYYICLLDKVFVNSNERVPVISKLIIWWKYWRIVLQDKSKQGIKCKKVTFLGVITLVFTPLIGVAYSVHKKIKK